MTGIERLVDIVNDGPYSGGMIHISVQKLREICEQIEAEAGVETIRSDAMRTWEWVREHGGLDHVRGQWGYLKGRANHADHVDRQLEKRQRQIDECHEALRRRNQRIAILASEINRAHSENRMEFLRRAGNYTAFADEVCKRLAPQLRYVEGCTKDVMDAALEALDRRLMPEGIEWPRFEDGELVGFGDEYVNAKGNVSTLRTIVIKDCRDRLGGGYYWKLGKGNCAMMVKNGERIKRPPVLAADGKPLESGQTVWGVNNGMEFTVSRLPKPGEYQAVKVRYRNGSSTSFDPDQLTHQRPVLDADGVPIKKGDEVYLTDEAWVLSEVPSVKGEPLVVTNFKYNRECPVCAIDQFDIENGITVPMRLKPGWVTHTKPEPDSWDSVWMDVSNGGETPQGMRRRCQALDGVSE